MRERSLGTRLEYVRPQTSEGGEEELILGHHGGGDDCITKIVTYAGNSALIGKIIDPVRALYLE